MVFGGGVAEHGSAMPGSHRRTNSTGDVIVARGSIGDQRTQHIEGGFAALLQLLFDDEHDLAHRNMARAFHYHLNVMLPSAAGKFTEGLELSQLGIVGGNLTAIFELSPKAQIHEQINII